jgi:hypothetical protein
MGSKMLHEEDMPLMPNPGSFFAMSLPNGAITWFYPTGDSTQGNQVAFPSQSETNITIGTSTGIYALPPTIRIDSVSQAVNNLKVTSAMSAMLGAILLLVGLESGSLMLSIGGIGLIGTVLIALKEALR